VLLNQLNIFIHHLHIQPITFQPPHEALQGSLKMNPVISYHSTDNDRFLPHILQIHLGSGDIELFVKAGQERLEPPALLLQ
jgi:hypothetical protein